MPNKKLSYEKVKQDIEDLGYKLITKEYNSCKQKLIIHDNQGYYYFLNYHNISISQKPYRKKLGIFNKYNPYTIQNIKLWCQLNNKTFILISEEYKNIHEKLTWKCLRENCGEYFETCWHDIYHGRSCPYCASVKVGLSNCLATKNSELAKEWHPNKNGDLTPYNVNPNSNKKVWWQCSKNQEHEWEALIPNRNKGSGCPQCNESRGEKRIKEWFNNNKIFYESQKEFDGLKGIGSGNLSYDFYLQQFNLLIEYQGQFHDGTAFQQSKKDFEKQQEHDRRKREYANQQQIQLLEIWYWDYDNIEKILSEQLFIKGEINMNNDKYIICSECEQLILIENMSKRNPSICQDCEGEKLLAEDD